MLERVQQRHIVRVLEFLPRDGLVVTHSVPPGGRIGFPILVFVNCQRFKPSLQSRQSSCDNGKCQGNSRATRVNMR